jgi:hypothetical protein
MALVNSTISGNRALAKTGGGIFNAGTFLATHCTIAQNRAAAGGGLVNNAFAEIGSCIIADNLADKNSSPDALGEILSTCCNLIQNIDGAVMTGATDGNIYGRAAGLSDLADNGGETPTHALVPGSPAIDSGAAGELSVDQRGYARVFDIEELPNGDDGSDMGSIESGAEAIPPFGGVPAVRLVTRREADGAITVTISENVDHRSWIIQASRDLHSWETVARPPATQFTTNTISGTRLFFRTVLY